MRQAINIFEKRRIFIPINIDNAHWAMCVVDFDKRCIEYYDSLGQNGIDVMKHIFHYMEDEHRQQHQCDIHNKDAWDFVNKETPQQRNGYDCGVFAIICADFLCDDLPLQFHQTDIKSFRLKICHSIRSGKLWYCDPFVQALL